MSAGVADVREAISQAQDRLGEHGTGTILFIDEVHRFNRGQQDALLPAVEAGLVVLIGATTENPYFSVNSPLLSRSTLVAPVPARRRRHPRDRGAGDSPRIGAERTTEAIDELVSVADGDARAALGTLEIAIALARGTVGRASRRREGAGRPSGPPRP